MSTNSTYSLLHNKILPQQIERIYGIYMFFKIVQRGYHNFKIIAKKIR